MKLAKASLKQKIIFLVSVISIVTVMVGAVGLMSLKNVSSRYEHVTKVNLPHSLLANDMLSNLRRIRIGLRTVALPNISASEANDAVNKAEDSINIYQKSLTAYKTAEYAPGVAYGPGEQELFESVVNKWTAYEAIAREVIRLQRTHSDADMAKLVDIFYHADPEAAKVCAAAIEKLIDYQSVEAKAWVEKANSAAASSNWIAIALILGGLGVSMSIGVYFANTISTVIGTIALELSNGSSAVASVANQVASASDSLSASTTQQAAALQETSASIEETSAMIAKNADNAKRSSEISERCQTIVQQAKERVSAMVDSIKDIADSNEQVVRQVNESNQEFSDIVRVIAEIGEKTKLIDDIVFQTKLLSFNASVEAARAGEHGKGFAVVAEEVGKLAAMSGASAKQITEMLASSKERVGKTVSNSKTRIDSLVQIVKTKVDAGNVTAKSCDEVLDEVVKNVSEVGGCVNEISAASQEQAQGVSEINKAIAELDSSSQANNTASQETARSADDLKGQVVGLHAMVDRLNAVVKGVSSTPKLALVSAQVSSVSEPASHENAA